MVKIRYCKESVFFYPSIKSIQHKEDNVWLYDSNEFYSLILLSKFGAATDLIVYWI